MFWFGSVQEERGKNTKSLQRLLFVRCTAANWSTRQRQSSASGHAKPQPCRPYTVHVERGVDVGPERDLGYPVGGYQPYGRAPRAEPFIPTVPRSCPRDLGQSTDV